ncbi:hypothetical protein LCGC14_1589500 [marine sediment metagenome]|uniref:Uncharacterized protein n=1 Tax=marine sediment metagenome TaxID=412755 RepID=A0A0F9LEV8_9ZZZZ
MAFTLTWSPEGRAQYDEIKRAAIKAQATRRQTKKTKSSRQEGLFKQVQKALTHLAANPRHPSLKTHKYSSIADPSGKKRDLFEAYAQNDAPGAYRIFWHYGPAKNVISVVAITPHP